MRLFSTSEDGSHLFCGRVSLESNALANQISVPTQSSPQQGRWGPSHGASRAGGPVTGRRVGTSPGHPQPLISMYELLGLIALLH